MPMEIVNWLYCLNIPSLLILLAAATAAVWYLDGRARWSIPALLLCWAGVVCCVTIGDRSLGQDMPLELELFHSYREVFSGGNPEILRSSFMNVVLFYPAGLLTALALPRKWPGWCRCILAVMLFGAMSAGIEYLQYRYAMGRCEIDDVLHNTIGVLLGSLAACRLKV